MGVTVLLPQVLQADAGGAARIDILLGAPLDQAVQPPDGAAPAVTVRTVLDELARRHPGLDRRVRDERGRLRRYVNVFVDSDECRALQGLDTAVPDGAEVRILPSVAGG
ncbi:MoaD/ThiS family protein [Streptomonospora nanhaiensis]|uniref:Molybdopterin converting factor small subunit n=1 Tax=Streptomonospora nanhaiensis TaxID=1323731 RepID=A0A853BHL1_9ACTN|nr:MoaD/ThiS family protein [Streptomonospora nanhaiensis]MBV2366375.1 MoaD/ThiS family protein [Streptomonospora nanhaiensis]NYI94111.1 molybdopterin converting factor small subunit [Streptomonospora nanhaiensis]